eukprot:2621557-Prymnesium_polylepis.1
MLGLAKSLYVDISIRRYRQQPHRSKYQLGEEVLRLAGLYGRDASSLRAQHVCAAKPPSLALRGARLMIQ